MNAVTNISMEHEKKLQQLFELAEDNQLAVQDAIACLTAEREALARERMTLAKASVNSAEVSDTLRKATAEAIPAIAAAADKSIQASMERALASSHKANEAFRRATADASDNLRRTATDAVPAIERAADRVIKDSMERALGLTQDAASRIWTARPRRWWSALAPSLRWLLRWRPVSAALAIATPGSGLLSPPWAWWPPSSWLWWVCSNSKASRPKCSANKRICKHKRPPSLRRWHACKPA